MPCVPCVTHQWSQWRHKELAPSLVREQHALVHAHALALVARGGHHHRGQVALACSRQAKSESPTGTAPFERSCSHKRRASSRTKAGQNHDNELVAELWADGHAQCCHHRSPRRDAAEDALLLCQQARHVH